MTSKLSIDFFKTFLLILCLINLSQQALNADEQLEADVEIKSGIQQNMDGFLTSDIVDFPNEMFAHLIIGDDDNVHVFFTQNGQQVGAEITNLNKDTPNTKVHALSGCRFQYDKLAVVYTLNDLDNTSNTSRRQFIQVIDINGNSSSGSPVEFSFIDKQRDQWLGQCRQLDDDTIGLTWYTYQAADNLTPDIYFRTYQPYLDQKLSPIDFQNTVNDQQDGWQWLSDIVVLKKNDRMVITWRGEGPADPTPGNNGVYFALLNLDGTPYKANIFVEGSAYTVHPPVHCYPMVEFSEDGGFTIVWNDDLGNINMASYDSEGEQICMKTVTTGKQWPTISASRDTLYIASKQFTDISDKLAVGKGYITQVSISQCKKLKEDVYSDENIAFVPFIRVNEGSLAEIVATNFIVEVTSGDYKLLYSEYFLEQVSECPNSNCYGCYGKKINDCILCAGSTEAKRKERLALSPSCECPADYFENSSKDCELCPNISYTNSNGVCKACLPTCDSCDNGYECTKCLDPVSNINLGCTCPTIFYKDSFNICQSCMNQCGSCSNNYSCDSCKDNQMMVESNCLVPHIGYTIILDSSGNVTPSKCSKRCETCTSSIDNCETCSGLNRSVEDNCNCLSRYHDNQGALKDCLQCYFYCSECVSEQVCTSCHPEYNRILDSFTGECRCALGFKIIDDSHICTKCYQIENGCVSSCPEQYIQNEKDMICEPINYSLTSNSGSIIVFAILIAIIQIGLCVGVQQILYKKYQSFQDQYNEQQIKLQQQRQHIYKDLELQDNSSKAEGISYGQTKQGNNQSSIQQDASPIKRRRNQKRVQQQHSSGQDLSVAEIENSVNNLISQNAGLDGEDEQQ